MPSEGRYSSSGRDSRRSPRIPRWEVRIAVQSMLFLLVGLAVLNLHGISFDLTPWSQVMINEIVDRFHPDPDLQDTAVVLFQEKNLRELGAGYPVSYAVQAEVLDAIASYRPRSVFIDFVFMDERGDSQRLRDSMCNLSTVVGGRLYLAAPLDEEGLARRGEVRWVREVRDRARAVGFRGQRSTEVLQRNVGPPGVRTAAEGRERDIPGQPGFRDGEGSSHRDPSGGRGADGDPVAERDHHLESEVDDV
jgi:hypothetical protein